MLKKIMAAAALCLALVACASTENNPTYPIVGSVDKTTLEQSAFAARSAYAVSLSLMVEYVSLPRCSATQKAPCSMQSVVNTMRQVELAADTATKGAVDLARSPTRTTSALVNAVSDAQRAIAVFRSTVTAYNAK